MFRCDECKHKDSCVCVPHGCESFELDLEEHDKRVRADAIDEFLDALKTYDKFGYVVGEFGNGNYLLRLSKPDEKCFVPYIHLEDVIKCAREQLKEKSI